MSWADAFVVPDTKVLMVSLRGAHTAATLQAWRTEVAAAWAPHCRAYVMDYRRALLAASAAELAEIVRDQHVAVPSAVICSRGQWATFVELARLMSHFGAMRMPFVDQGSALRWARVAAGLGASPQPGPRKPPRHAADALV